MKKLFFLLVILLSFFLIFLFVSCKKSPTFNSLTISKRIDEKTLEPLEKNDTFEISDKEIYAVIAYSNASVNDTYFFVWSNLNTGKKITTEKYFLSNKENLESGNLVSVFKLKEGSSAISPGKYKVEFIYNNKLKASAFFEVTRPEIEINSFELATKPVKDASKTEELKEFKQTDIIYLTLEVNYLPEGHSFLVKWFDEKNKLIKEEAFNIEKDNFNNRYIYFALQSDTGIFHEGNYEVEIFLDKKLINTIPFKITKSSLELSAFSKGTIYENSKKDISFLVPDNWKVLDVDKKEKFQVQIVPPLSRMEIGFLFLITTEIKDFSEDSFTKIAENISKPFVSEKELIIAETQKNSGVTDNEIKYFEIRNSYTDKNKNQWLIPACFIVRDSDVCVFYGIVNEVMFPASVSDEIFYGILNSLKFTG